MRAHREGLGSDIKTIERMCADDPVTFEMVDRALKEGAKHGGNHGNQHTGGKNDNITLATQGGTSRQAALRALREHAPEIHKQVKKGALSAHAGMLKAGLRPKTITVPVDVERADCGD